MLELLGHDRYDYSAITKRADYTRPDGKRSAFYIALNLGPAIAVIFDIPKVCVIRRAKNLRPAE